MNPALKRIMQAGSEDYFELTDCEQDIYLLASLINAVNDGDFLTFYKSDCGAYHEQLLELLNTLELEETAFALDSFGAIFPEGYPPEDNAERCEIIDDISEEFEDLFKEWNEQIRQFAKELEAELENLLKNLN